MTSDTPACFTDISPADVALQLHGDSTPARQQLQQQYDTSITQPKTFQQETVCFTDISPTDVALQLHGDSTPARQQLQQQSDTPITQPETFQRGQCTLLHLISLTLQLFNPFMISLILVLPLILL
ncbi:hypothetical protein H0E87_030422 [Populus deltoides]|uniref:Uncharacterized protein n=1 Tax=Populus deltoides TaxID=3696 RepID=A0A8T2WJ53_POPDE|nr:hypothetical protein H0E87_030422 [Populus deltoides]